MSYQTYTTEAIVCGMSDSYTSDRSYLLLTESAGMLWATARSAREEKSKQRYALQPFSLVTVSLVKGKGGWRIGSVAALSNQYFAAESRQARAGVVQVIRLVRRLVQGEEPIGVAYKDVAAVIQQVPELTAEQIPRLIDQFTLRFLWRLGYIPSHESYQSMLHDQEWLTDPKPLEAAAEAAVSRGLEASHL